MRLLLDSHVALWWLGQSPSLGEQAQTAITDADEVHVSVVTPWELGIKRAIGKLSMPGQMVEALTGCGFSMLCVSPAHAELAPTLDRHHRDPFDRMLVAQAMIESLALVTADEHLAAYGIDLVDARR